MMAVQLSKVLVNDGPLISTILFVKDGFYGISLLLWPVLLGMFSAP